MKNINDIQFSIIMPTYNRKNCIKNAIDSLLTQTYQNFELIIVDDNSSDIYSLFERELGRTLSSYEYEIIGKWIEKGVSEDTIKRALKEAILNGVTNFKYIDKIIYDWSKNSVKQREKKETLEDLFDYDWLDDNE